ncbi:MAG: hypothetical protein ACLFPS_04755 [Clostridia bacterium]
MDYLLLLTIGLIILSFIIDKDKTIKGVKIGLKKLKKILPQFLLMLILISIVLYLLPGEVISKYLGGNHLIINTVVAAFLGSITMMPGFIAFPLCGILLTQGVSYMVLAAFSTTLMVVGFVTFPIEKQYYGISLSIKRNLFCFMIGIIVAIAVGLVFGEIII